MTLNVSVTGAWRRLVRWTLTGETATPRDRVVEPNTSLANDDFLANLDEGQRLAVLGAIVSARRPVPETASAD